MKNEKLNELIKLAIGNRSLRQVEEESGISHGLLGKVINNTQKASVDLLHKLTVEEAHPQNGVTYLMLMEAANYIPADKDLLKRNITREATADDFVSLREKRGMTRLEFCEWLGIPYRTVQDWELGNRQAPFYVFNLIKEKVERDLPERNERKASVLDELRKNERRDSFEKGTKERSEPNAR